MRYTTPLKNPLGPRQARNTGAFHSQCGLLATACHVQCFTANIASCSALRAAALESELLSYMCSTSLASPAAQ